MAARFAHSDRIHVCEKIGDRYEFRKILGQVDVILDTCPWGGWTTTLQALAAGTPIVTFPQSDSRSRFVTNIYENYLSSVPRDLIATSADDYVNKAIDAGNNFERLKEIKQLFAESSQVSEFRGGNKVMTAVQRHEQLLTNKFV